MKKTAISILGSGTCVPSLERAACCVLAKTGESKILFDLGPGIMRRLLEDGVAIHEITHIFLSHFHPDHCAELVPFLFALKYPDFKKRSKPLSVIAGKGLETFFGRLQRAWGDWMAPDPDFFRLMELDLDGPGPRRMAFPDFVLEWAPANHRPESAAFKITDAAGKSLVYSGDTDESENVMALSKNADVLVCESAMPDDLKVDGHLTPSLAGEIARKAGLKRLILTHFYPECLQADPEGQARKTFGGDLIMARDLMRIEL
ncbi:Beta-lactamase domain protein [Candidatus Desulfarcum epimagneticum]|uniref:Beta-lactamase domain protein n=1 Tax=uncultured Desulfobacteraceae bacterium TaxID=218296 RepID=A0A484HEG9_9BACT|nr:Beta-lactamase domain protein [uncultured Desulfobacteraceae bacterium]